MIKVLNLETNLHWSFRKNSLFGLYADEDILADNGSKIPAGGLVSVTPVGEDMTARFNEQLPFGRYYVQEISTDEKYVISGEKHIVTFGQ